MPTQPWYSFAAHNATHGTQIQAFAVQHPRLGALVVLRGVSSPDAAEGLQNAGFVKSKDGRHWVSVATQLNREALSAAFPLMENISVDTAHIDVTEAWLNPAPIPATNTKSPSNADQDAQARANLEKFRTEVLSVGGMRGLRFFLVNGSGRIASTGSQPHLIDPLLPSSNLPYYASLADEIDGRIYVAPLVPPPERITDEPLIFGYTWSDIQAMQQGQRATGVLIDPFAAKLPEGALLVYDANQSSDLARVASATQALAAAQQSYTPLPAIEQLEAYVIDYIQARVAETVSRSDRPDDPAVYRLVSEVESTDPGIAEALEAHPQYRQEGFSDLAQALDNGNVRQAIIGSREIVPWGASTEESNSEPSANQEESLAPASEHEPIPLIPAEPDAPSPRGSGPIEDFGEVLDGARKHAWRSYADSLIQDKESLRFKSLAEALPKPDYNQLLAEGATPELVAYLRVLRESVSVKPRAGARGSSFSLPRWVNEMDDAIAQTRHSLDMLAYSEEDQREFVQTWTRKFSEKQRASLDLYAAAGHAFSFKGFRVEPGYTEHADDGSVTPNQYAVIRTDRAPFDRGFPRMMAYGPTRQEAIASFAAKLPYYMDSVGANESGKKNNTKEINKYSIYTDTSTGDRFIGRKLGRLLVRVKCGFATVTDARDYRENNLEELGRLFNELRDTPDVRNAENSPRIGPDLRAGQDVRPEQFEASFGFRGVQFGEWVEQGRRQRNLNEAFDALHDLADILSIPPRAISLGGQLGLAFGARGTGGKNPAAAHFEPSNFVINLTKRAGAGCLAHEWFHALDNHLARKAGYLNGFVTDLSSNRRGFDGDVATDFAHLRSLLLNSPFSTRSKELDQTRSKDYWSTVVELGARAFEAYVRDKLKEQDRSNDFLVNIVQPHSWREDDKNNPSLGAFPYPHGDELIPLNAAFDKFLTSLNLAAELNQDNERTAIPLENLNLDALADALRPDAEEDRSHTLAPSR